MRQVLPALERLDREQPAQGITRAKLEGNAYWPKELAELPGNIPHEAIRDLSCPSPSRKPRTTGARALMFYGAASRDPTGVLEDFYHAPGRNGVPSMPPISYAGCCDPPMAKNRNA